MNPATAPKIRMRRRRGYSTTPRKAPVNPETYFIYQDTALRTIYCEAGIVENIYQLDRRLRGRKIEEVLKEFDAAGIRWEKAER